MKEGRSTRGVAEIIAQLPAQAAEALASALAGPAPRGRPAHGRSRRPRLALIAWFFPPHFSVGVRRPMALAAHAARQGWDVDVLTGPGPIEAAPAGLDLLGRVPPAVRVHQIQIPHVLAQVPPELEVDGGLGQALAVPLAARRLLPGSAPDVVLATGPPFSSFIAGAYLAKWTGARLVLDYRDEWTECPFDWVVKGPADPVWERACLRDADAVVFTTPSALEHQLAAFPMLSRARCSMIPNGWEPADFVEEQGGERPAPVDGPVTLSYAGTLAVHSLPGTFLDPLSIVLQQRPDLRARIRLRLVGRVTPPAEEQIARFPHPELLERVGVVATAQAARLISQSDALLQPNAPDLMRYRPLKIYDYLTSDRPILVFGDGGEIARLARELDAGWIVPAGQPQVLEAALDEIFAHRGNVRPSAQRSAWLAAHTREAMAERFLELCGRLARAACPEHQPESAPAGLGSRRA